MTNDNKDPNVTVFGQRFNTEQWEHDASQRVVWGSMLLFAGIIFMLNTLDRLPWEIWENILPFWPVLLILAGLSVILGASAAARWISALITVSTFGLIMITVLAEPFPELLSNLPAFFGELVNFIKDLVN